MKINRYSDEVGGLLPEAVVTLSSNFAVPLYHTAHQHKIRHPLGAYNISTLSVLANFEFVLQQLFQLFVPLPDGDVGYKGTLQLGEAQRNLLRSIDEHFDDCEKILKAFFAPGERFNGNEHVERFRDSIEPYRGCVRRISNHFKHSQGRVRGCIVIPHITLPQLYMPCYYIEGIIDEYGSPGPDPEIHADDNRAISFFRDLRYHFCNLYFISHYLAQAISNIVGSHNMTPPESVNSSDDQCAAIAKVISELPLVFLRHEMTALDIPKVEISQAEDVVHLSLALPSEPLPSFD